MSTNKLKTMRKALHITSRILACISVVLIGIFVIADTLLTDKAVEVLLTDFVFTSEELGKPADIIINSGKEAVRYKTWYSSVEDNLNGNGEIAWYAQGEGTVLLQNDKNTLPLAAGDKVSLYGVTGYDPMYCLDGAGNNKINSPLAYDKKAEENRRQFFYDEFEKVGLEMNKNLETWYNGDGTEYRRFDTIGFWGKEDENGTIPQLTEAAWEDIPASGKNQGAFGKNTTAVYVTGRMTNEAADLPNAHGEASAKIRNKGAHGETTSTDYMALTPTEIALITALKANYSKLIVIFNQANAPQSDIPEVLKSTADCSVAGIWAGFTGSDGIKAVADILVGTLNPSGGLSAGWYTAQKNNPSMRNYSIGGNVTNVEGMYVGYRYAETRYEDILNGAAKAGSYDYDAQVSYPFGHGLSYTSFDYSDVSVAPDPDPEKNYYSGGLMASNNGKFDLSGEGYSGNHGKARPDSEKRATGDNVGDCDDIILSVTVTNTGAFSGKEIVQVYLQQPITDTDRAHGVQKPAVQLVGYGKTDILAPAESQTLQIKIDANKWFAAYDDKLGDGEQYTGGGYVLSAGDYKLVAARNAHEAVNSIYLAKGGKATDANFDDGYGMGNAGNVATVTVSENRSENYKYWTQGTTDEVHNLFGDVNPNKDGDASNDIKFFSRYDWAVTAAIDNGYIGMSGTGANNADNSSGTFNSRDQMTAALIDNYERYYNVEFDTTQYEYGQSDTEYDLVDLIGVEYDAANGASEADVKKWADIVGQLTDTDIEALFSSGRRQTPTVTSINKPGTIDQNASNGFEWKFGTNTGAGMYHKFDSTAKIAYPTGYPCEGIIAATFNNDVALLVGKAIGEDALWTGASGLYGFGLGLQRNPYHGRAGEFYSDDPFLTGMIGGYETLGAQSKGLYVYNKHFVLNDQDHSRSYYSSWLDEQTMRQVYLRPFEMAIEIGDAMNVMIAFNKIGKSWGGSNYNLMTRWLRGEAGMLGFAISDWYEAPNENLGYGMLAGTDILDGPSGGSGFTSSNNADVRFKNCVVQSATRILYTVANSNAMNFIGAGTEILHFEAKWIYYRDVLLKRFGASLWTIFGLSMAFVVGTAVWTYLDERKSLMR